VAFCGLCGGQLNDTRFFCLSCGLLIKEQFMKLPRVDSSYEKMLEQIYVSKNMEGSTFIFRFEQNNSLLSLANRLNVSIDHKLNFNVYENTEIVYNIEPGHHEITVLAINSAGLKTGNAAASFFIGYGDLLKITYKPQASRSKIPAIQSRKIK